MRFTSSYRELVAALRAINRAVPLVRRMRQLAWIAIAIVAVLIVANVLTFRGSLGVLFVPGLILLLFWLMPFYLAWMTQRSSPYWTGEQLVELSDEGIRIGSAASETFVEWAAIMRTTEDRRFFLFFSSDQSGQFVPKRVLATDEQSRVRQLFRDNAGEERVGAHGTASAPSSEPPAVEVRFELEAAESARAGMVAARKAGALWVWYVVILGIVLWTTMPTAYAQWQRGGWGAISVPMLLLGMAPLLIVFAAGPLVARLAARRALRTGPSTRGSQAVGVAEWGIRVAGPMYTGELRWLAFMKAVETDEFFLFFISKLQPVFIPKRLLTPAGADIIRNLTRAGLGARAELLRREA